MLSQNAPRPAAPIPSVGKLKPLRLRSVVSPSAALQAARRPMVPTHVAGTTNHARRHVPRSAQS